LKKEFLYCKESLDLSGGLKFEKSYLSSTCNPFTYNCNCFWSQRYTYFISTIFWFFIQLVEHKLRIRKEHHSDKSLQSIFPDEASTHKFELRAWTSS